MKELCRDYPHFEVNYAIKANSNLALLRIAREEGLHVDLSSSGEAAAAFAAGFEPHEMLYIVNSVSGEDMDFAASRGITVSVDSLSQLDTFGKRNNGGKIAVRFNTGVGEGHHQSVITGGEDTKFGILSGDIPAVKELLAKHNLKLVGITQHIGSGGSEDFTQVYLQGVKGLLAVCEQFEGLEFIDMGGGFPIPYKKQEGEKPLDLEELSIALTELITNFANEYSAKNVTKPTFMIEPGRYIAAECGILLGTVHSIKYNGTKKYAGSDIGFSTFARHTLYEAHHDIEIYRRFKTPKTDEDDEFTNEAKEVINIVGNMCESGDYIAKNRLLPVLQVGDIIAVQDAGAYGYSMSSHYNLRPRPAEVLITQDGAIKQIRRRDSVEDMLKNMINLY